MCARSDDRQKSDAVADIGKMGQIDDTRDAVFIGRERHVERNARADWTPYPQRAIRTADFLYIINFHPERWPLGDPYRLEDPDAPTFEQVSLETRATCG